MSITDHSPFTILSLAFQLNFNCERRAVTSLYKVTAHKPRIRKIISRILFALKARTSNAIFIIPLKPQLPETFSDPTRKLCADRTQTLSYLILLHVEFSCFHSSNSPESSRSHFQDQCSGHSLCSTGPHLAVDGRYPLRRPMESGLSSRHLLLAHEPTSRQR